MTDEAITATTPQSLDAGTEYVILRLGDDQDQWERVFPPVTARTSEAAIRKALEDSPPEDGTFVAIPARSWHPVTVRTKTTTTLHLEEAKS